MEKTCNVKKSFHLDTLLHDFGIVYNEPTLVFCDITSAIRHIQS